MPKFEHEMTKAERDTYYHAHGWIIKHIVAVADGDEDGHDKLTEAGMEQLLRVVAFFVNERIAIRVPLKDLPAALRATV